jgi:hypothetical protein
MIKIAYPPYTPRIKREDKERIFDPFRKKWVSLTPEEWVRQNFLQYLVQTLHYPPALIAIEKEIKVGEMRKRFDIVVYRNEMPFMLVECKEMNVPLSKETLYQLLRYNTNMQAGYLIITNGSYCIAFQKKEDSFEETELIPLWKET